MISISTSADGVRVLCDDGSVEHGSIVIGADGVHSRVRHLMRDMAQKAGATDLDDEQPFEATYKVMFGTAPRAAQLRPGGEWESHGPRVTTQLFVGETKMWFFVYQKLDEPARRPQRFTRDDEEAYAARWGDVHLTDDLLFRDVYATRLGAGMTNLEEGILKNWSWDRIVLVGDAAHKVTPNFGWGFNSGVQDLVVLTNALRGLLAQHDGQLDTATISALFAGYQEERIGFMRKIVELSGRVTRMGAWQNGAMWLLDRYLFPALHADQWLARHSVGKMVAKVPVLNFLEEKHFRAGRIPWVHTANLTR